jgi:hypothetical protein
MQRLLALAEGEMSSLKVLGIWSMLWALVRLEVVVPDTFLDRLADKITRRFRELPLPKTHIVSGVVWAYARLRPGKEPTPAQVCTALSCCSPKFSCCRHVYARLWRVKKPTEAQVRGLRWALSCSGPSPVMRKLL